MLDHADFLTHFLDLSQDALLLPYLQVPLDKLQSLLELVLRNPASVSAHDPYKDELKVTVHGKGTRLLDEMLRLTVEEGMTQEQFQEEKNKRARSVMTATPSAQPDAKGSFGVGR